MNKQNKKTVMQWFFVALMLIGGFMLYRDVQSKIDQAAVAPVSSGETVTNVDPAGAVSQTSDATPNYDPDDPYGVKFGMTGLGYLLLFFFVMWALQEGFQAVSKKRGGGGS